MNPTEIEVDERMDEHSEPWIGSYADVLVLAFVIFTAIGIVYLVGFEPSHPVHDTFHNVRHASGFPCH